MHNGGLRNALALLDKRGLVDVTTLEHSHEKILSTKSPPLAGEGFANLLQP
jgi:hypothetical protein